MEAIANPVPVPKRTPLHETPGEVASALESKNGKGEDAGQATGSVPKESSAREPEKLDPEGASVLPQPASKTDMEGRSLAEDPAEGRVLPGPKWCPGSVRRATLEFEERLRQEQHDMQHASPIALFPVRKNSRNETPGADPAGKGRNDDLPHEPAQSSKNKEASRVGSDTETGTGSEPPAEPSLPPEVPAEVSGLAREHRMVLWMEGDEGPPLLSPLPKRIEIIEYTPALPSLPGTDRAEKGGTTQVPEKTLDENCNSAFCSENPGGDPEQEGNPFSKALFSWGSPEKGEGETRAAADIPSPSANWVRHSPPPCLCLQQHLGLEGVTQGSTSTDPEPAPLGGYAGNGRFSLEERGTGFLPWTHWIANLGEAPWEVARARPLRCSLPRRSSCDGGAKDSRHQGSGLVKQLAKELESRLRHAGLTAPSQMKRSASLAKLDCLGSLKDDLPARCCLPYGVGPASLESLRGLSSPIPDSADSLPALLSPQPTKHLVEPVKLWESLALSRPVERPLAQFAQDFTRPCGTPDGTWTWTEPVLLPRNPSARTRLPRRLKKSNERKRTTNPVYNTM